MRAHHFTEIGPPARPLLKIRVGLALFVLIEKITPAGARIGQLIGAVLVVWGGALLLGP